MWSFLTRLLDTSDFPPRWQCGVWSAEHGWLHIVSDLGVWSEYVAIPCVLLYFVFRCRDLPFSKIFWLFGAFILACGTTHLMEAIIFWWPAYRLAGLVKLFTAVVSWTTVVALIKVAPQALALRSPKELEREMAERTADLAEANESLKAEVAQRQQAVAEQQRAAEALREADRLKDEFLAILGHELRNPLAGISGAVQALDLIGSQQPEAHEMRGIIQRQSQHMSRLIDDLLDVSRISRGKLHLRPEPLDLVELVRRTCHDFRQPVEQGGLQFVFDLPDQPVWVEGDPTRLAQVLFNLLNNACKFTNRGGTLAVRLTLEDSGDACFLRVRDTGIGMSSRTLNSLFDPFRQGDHSVDRNAGGLGVGLALVKGLIQLHGGQVSAASEGLGHGSEFTIRLPWVSPPAALSSFANVSPGLAAAFRILIVDDSRDAAYPMQMLLAKMQHQVEWAEDGRSGLEAARRFRPDLVLCDIGLPGGMNGYEVAQALRRDPITKNAYLVAVTGYGQEEDRRKASEAGFDEHLPKPVSVAALNAMLARLATRNSRPQ